MKLKTLNEIKPRLSGFSLVEFDYLKANLREEAIKRVKNCCGECRIDNDTCDACKRDIWFNNLTEEDLKKQ